MIQRFIALKIIIQHIMQNKKVTNILIVNKSIKCSLDNCFYLHDRNSGKKEFQSHQKQYSVFGGIVNGQVLINQIH